MKLSDTFRHGVAALALTSFVAPAVAEAADIAIVGGRADDPFFAKVKRGIDDAATIVESRGGTVTYLPLQTYDQIGPDAANLIRTAINQGVDGIAAPNWVPDAQDSAYRAASDAGIPILLYNAGGSEKTTELGGVNYVGTEDYTAGLAAGEYLGSNAVENVLCVNTVPGAANLEARCQGIIDGVTAAGGEAEQLPLPASAFGDPNAVAEAIKSSLLNDATIDGVVTQGNQDADSAAVAIAQAGAQDRVHLGTFNLDDASLRRIQEGTQMFVIDQQGYLQGFLAVFLLDSFVNYGMTSPTQPILTGPVIVDASNIDATLQGVEAGVR